MSKFTMKNKLKLAFLAIAAITSVSFISGCSTGAHGEQIFGMTGSVAWFRTASMQTKSLAAPAPLLKGKVQYGRLDYLAELLLRHQAGLTTQLQM